MKAVIMAGGEGTRLRPLTCDKPKPLVQVMGKPVMEHIINLLKRHGITEIAVTLQYLPQSIINYFGDGEAFGVSINYYVEDSPLGTAGSVKNAQAELTEDFLIISGDALTDMDLSQAIRFHREKNSSATLLLHRVEQPLEYGVVVTKSDGAIDRFLEKPDWSEVLSDTVNTGIYILNPKVLNEFNAGEFFDFAKDLFPKLLEKKEPMYGCITGGYWCDIGDIDAYINCHYDMLNGKVGADLSCSEGLIDPTAVIEQGAVITPPCFVGAGAHILSGAVVSESVIGANCVLRGGASVKRGILWNGVNLARGSQVRGAVLCEGAQLGNFSQVYEGSVVGQYTQIGANSAISPNIKIWPHKNVADNTQVNENLVWGSKSARKLFGEEGIRGEINVDVTPEYAAKIGSAFGAVFRGRSAPKGKIGLGYDGSPAGHMLMSAVSAGLLSAGCQVYDFGEQLLPITRSAVKFYGLDGGIHLSVSEGTGADLALTPEIEMLTNSGASVTRDIQKKLENAFIREDFVRCEPQNIREPMVLHNYKYYYLRDIINSVEPGRAPQHSFKIETNSETARELLTLVTDELGVKTDGKAFAGSISMSGEVFSLYGRDGKKISSEQYLALVILVMTHEYPSATVVLPISASKSLEMMVKKAGGSVVYSKTSAADFMRKILEVGSDVQFKLCFDGIYAAVKLPDFFNKYNLSLDALLGEMPKFHKVTQEVTCDDKNKGYVIRQLLREFSGDDVETTEGVKIYGKSGWTLVLPHNTRNVVSVISEGRDMEAAEELTAFFTEKIENFQKSIAKNEKV